MLLCQVKKVAKGKSDIKINSGEDNARIRQKASDIKKESLSRIYLDHNATTPIDPQVKQVMIRFLEQGQENPSGIYQEGKEARAIIESARRTVANLINTTAKRIIFTGGGPEADNLALKGIALAVDNKKRHLISSTIEHPAILNTCAWLEQKGFKVTYLPVDTDGLVNPADLRAAISEDTFLISAMAANNETGVIQPIEELVNIAHQHNILFYCDAVQAVAKIPIDVKKLDVDLLTLSAHKFYGPKGIAALFIKKGVQVDVHISGSKQESSLRAGAGNVLAIAGLGTAAELAIQRLPQMAKVKVLRDKLERGIKEIFSEAQLNGHSAQRLPGTLNLHLPGLRGESVVLALDPKGVALSSGSACRAGSPNPSHALLAMGLSEEEAHCSIRLLPRLHTTEQEIDLTLERFNEVINDAKSNVRFVPCR